MPQPNWFNLPIADNIIMPHKHEFSTMPTSETAMDILENGGIQVWERTKESATELDIFSIRWKNREEIIALIKKKIWIDIETKEGIKEMNEAYKDAVRFYEEVLYRKTWSLWKINFKTAKEVIDFIQQTDKWWTKSQIYCNLVKLTFNNHRASSDEKLQDLDEKAKWLIAHKLNPIIQLKKPWFPFENEKEKAVITTTLANWVERKTEFFVRFRGKTADSSKLKLLYNPEYTTTSAIMDGIWLQVEAKNEEWLLIALDYLQDKFFWGELKDLRTKHIYTEPSKIESFSEILSEEFLEKLNGMIEKKKPWSKQRTVTMIWEKRVPINPTREGSQEVIHSTEIQWVLSWNKNNSGLSNHRIYDQAKKITAMIRLQWYVTENYIKLIINKMYDENPDLEFNKENVLQHYKDNLITIYFDWDTKKKPYYSTANRYATLKIKWWLYPEDIKSEKWDKRIVKMKEEKQKRIEEEKLASLSS